VPTLRIASLVAAALTLVGCATAPSGTTCPRGMHDLPGCPPEAAVADPVIDELYRERTWIPARELELDPVTFSTEVDVPVNEALIKVIGPEHDSAMDSLAAKIWLIEHAQHTVDVMYYIFQRDLVGYSVLGALCDAVGRGVDVRIMVDSLGSFSFTHSELKALRSCADSAGFLRNEAGEITTRRARVQAVVFNAVSKLHFNRRSHDKLLVVDGHFPDQAAVITGGRNISLDYYGIEEDGSEDPTAYRDLEILLRVDPDREATGPTVGSVSEYYYSLLFLYEGNKRLGSAAASSGDERSYRRLRERFRESLARLESLPEMRERLARMEAFTRSGLHPAQVRLAHQLNNLTSRDVTHRRLQNLLANPNSINYILARVIGEERARGELEGTLRIVSPYLFSSRYEDAEGEVVYDGAQALLQLLEETPDSEVEIVTNSVMTSDNVFAQAIIDMDMAPRLLLTPELQERWLSGLRKGELDRELVESEEWQRLVDNPRIRIYQTGRLDSVLLGGTAHYGKLHAKYIVGDDGGFVGTSNFDYRSILYNNEMGFFFLGDGVRDDLLTTFEALKATSYLWGSPEWLEMRRQLMESDSKKAGPARKQRMTFKLIRALGLEYLM